MTTTAPQEAQPDSTVHRLSIEIDDRDRYEPSCADTPWTANLVGADGPLTDAGLGATPEDALRALLVEIGNTELRELIASA